MSAAKTLFFVTATVLGAAVVNGQSAPNWQYIPSACSSQCAQTIQSAYLCETSYSSNTDVYGCFCNNYPSDASDCASCLNSNDAAALASLLTSTQTACPAARQQCFFECSFDTCPSSDIACQCAGTYLENIYNCASCNTANNNAGTTQITDFNNLQQSCAAQNYTGASSSFSTIPLPTIATAAYNAPSLTATGGGAAATGAASDLGGGAAAGATGSAGGSGSSGTNGGSGTSGTNSGSGGTGASGNTGSSGANGASGNTGSSGANGASGNSGAGSNGAAGGSAAAGSAGAVATNAAGTTALAGSSATAAAGSGSARAGTASGASGSAARTGSAASGASAAPSSSSSAASGAENLVVPAFGGVLAVAGAVLALL
ncbi:hypothetical protein IAR55_003637 [Kwoniella newhampshirensis]|uniref:Uncharacterized protein n=1 Tax=Kwoniella newhampshirensis TaxID=1651941 RepID=A0AAW0Z1D9_9TREE